MNKIKLLLLICFFSCAAGNDLFAQCCSAGSGSPLGGNTAQGVLQQHQLEINPNIQYIHSKRFFTGDHRDKEFLDHFTSNYLYTRIGYGLTKDLTISLESGYFVHKTQVGLNKSDTITSRGIGDLIIFPRYNIINKGGISNKFEWTAGLGFKLPLGKYNDSIRKVEPLFNIEYYYTKPLAVQPSSGSIDLLFYSYISKSFPQNYRLFATGLYIRKGWNPLGEKYGDYSGIGIGVGKAFSRSFAATLQVKGEKVNTMKLNENIRLYAYPDYDPDATGSKKLFIVPQVSYNYKDQFSFYIMNEIPLYQYVVKTQIGSQYQISAGFSYRFNLKGLSAEPPENQI